MEKSKYRYACLHQKVIYYYKFSIISLNIDKGKVEPKIFFMLLSSSLPIQTPTT